MKASIGFADGRTAHYQLKRAVAVTVRPVP